MKNLILLAVALLLAGCASFVQDAEQANDIAINTWARLGCATPFSAVLRNPQIIPALNSLCKGKVVADPESVTK